MSSGKEIQSNIHKKAYRDADQIIRFLLKNDDQTVELTETEKKTLEKCAAIHGYRLRFMQKEQVIAVIKNTYGVKDQQARNLINKTEEIFGTIGKVHKDYERQFLLNASVKNIELAMAGRNSTQITKALLAHYKIAGLEEFVPDMPDFSKLEQHKYLISVPAPVVKWILSQADGGVLNLIEKIPPPNLDMIQDAEEVK